MEGLVDQDGWDAFVAQAVAPEDVRTLVWTHDFAMWQALLPSVMPRMPGGRVIEIGSAPGRLVLRLARVLGAEPFGVEHTARGAALNRATFVRNGVSPGNVIEADFFDDAFLARHREGYDCVSSFGFIEHFDDPRPVIARHLELLKPGGILVISIPNFGSLNTQFARLFEPSILPSHNMTIMPLPAFRALFDGMGLDEMFAGFVGRFHFMFRGPCSGWRRWLQLAIMNLQTPICWVLSRLPWSWNLDSRWFSPYLFYIARKPAA